MKLTMKLVATASFVFLLFSFSCAPNPEDAAVEKAVETYNVALVQAYRDVDLNYMKPFITDNERNRLYPLMLALEAAGSRMVAIQDDFKVQSVSTGKIAATLKSKETWTYWWEDVATGGVTKPKAVLRYTIVYHLTKEKDGRWVVDGLDPLPQKR